MDVVVDLSAWTRAALGGALIGLAAALMFAFNGRIAGISGVIGGLVLDSKSSESSRRLLFLTGVVLGAGLMAWRLPAFAAATLQTGWAGMIIAGLIVGFGTRMGGGCTSGHGVCGVARLSRRSMLATATFMLAGFITVFLLRHVFGDAA